MLFQPTPFVAPFDFPIYNALGQRIQISGGVNGTVLYAYDEAGHLLGEYDGTGTLIEETVWLGDIPVATLKPSGSSVALYYIHTDQLNTPRQVTRPSDNVAMWTWNSDPFGTDAANPNPAGAGAFTYNLRFAGQIFDGQAGLHQNDFRDYDPATGRYATSDPIGLQGGLNTYAYVDDGPLAFSDPSGLIFVNPIEVLGRLVYPKPWTQDVCEQLLQTIANLNTDIEKRYRLIRSNPQNLPQWGPTSSSPNRDSVNGHWREMNRLDRDRRKNERDYDRHCRNNCPPGAGAPVTDPNGNSLTTATGGAAGVILIIAGVLILL